MNDPRDPDLIIAAWLDENASPLPESTRRAIDVATRATPQRRPGWLPGRTTTMHPFFRLGVVAAAIVVVAIGSLTVLRPSADPGGPTSAPPSAAPSPSGSAVPDPSDWQTYTSPTFGFEVRFPAGFEATPAIGPNPIYVEDSTAELDFDRVTAGAGFSGLYVASAPMAEDAATPEDWLRRYACPCENDLDGFERTTIDGHPAFAALESGGEQVLGYWVFTGDRVYRILAVNLLVRDEALREAFLSTLRLLPADAVDTP